MIDTPEDEAPHAGMLADDIMQRLFEGFSDSDASVAAAQLTDFIELFRTRQGTPPSDRLLRCLVHLAAGDKRALAQSLRLALTDWRDVIHAAEYAASGEQVHDFAQPFSAGDKGAGHKQDAASADMTSAQATVVAFITAMNLWERQSWTVARLARDTAAPDSYWPEITAALARVFAEFCTARARPQGRAGSFQRPPEYDPASEQIVDCVVHGKRAHVDTQRTGPLGGRFRYTLHQLEGRWQIDKLQEQRDGDWTSAIL